jgi:serine/threonine-protein kinase HipA
VYFADDVRGVPALVDLPVLLNAAERLERDDVDAETLRALLRGGSSLGGARPKAHVLDRHGRVSIAKFPSPANDDWDVMRWEAVALRLAAKAGVRVPPSALHEIDGRPVLVVDRFDRAGEQRIGYVSAMTMLEATDGEQASYTDIALVIEEQSPTATEDLRELWRRVALSILVSNTDDHLRNHGFLRSSSGGWRLSPAFDINPNPEPGPKFLSTALDVGDAEARIDTLLALGPYFRLDADQARSALREVALATRAWRDVALDTGVNVDELELMEAAFEHEQVAVARDLARV